MVKKIKPNNKHEEEHSIRDSAYDVIQDALVSVRNALDGDCCLGCAYEALETISGCAKILKRS
jgi:hypothetical protein